MGYWDDKIAAETADILQYCKSLAYGTMGKRSQAVVSFWIGLLFDSSGIRFTENT